jgi:hypothetical protein
LASVRRGDTWTDRGDIGVLDSPSTLQAQGLAACSCTDRYTRHFHSLVTGLSSTALLQQIADGAKVICWVGKLLTGLEEGHEAQIRGSKGDRADRDAS